MSHTYKMASNVLYSKPLCSFVLTFPRALKLPCGGAVSFVVNLRIPLWLTFVSFVVNVSTLSAQPTIHSLLDELNADYNTSVKPLTRPHILSLLESIDTTTLNPRQKHELTFYLKDYNKEKYPHKNFPRRKDVLYLRDNLFSLTINPIAGGEVFLTANGNAWHWWNGLYAHATAGNWSFYASLTDNHESEKLMSPSFLTQRQGGANIKRFSDGKQDYWDSRGGVTYDWGKGHIGLVKDNFTWGSGYNGSIIFSGRTPSFAHLSLQIRPVNWFEFNYVHGWLASEVVDSARSFYYSTPSGPAYRKMYHRKFMAANMFTFKPLKELQISAGNAIIYDYDNAHPAYFIPVLFFKAVDHHLQSGMDNMNSMMFMDISVKPLPNTHLYATVFVDELAVKRIFDPDEFNYLSIKGGLRLNNLIENTWFGAEYTWTNVYPFRHYVPTLSYESNRYNLGHYLTDNAQEFFATAGYRPFPLTAFEISYTRCLKGPDHTVLGSPRLGIIPFTPIVWESDAVALKASWQVINDVWVYGGYTWQHVRGEQGYLDLYTPAFMQGKKGIVNLGVRISR